VEDRLAADDLVEDREGPEAKRGVRRGARVSGQGNESDKRGQEQK
jgi:hypothetical protein